MFGLRQQDGVCSWLRGDLSCSFAWWFRVILHSSGWTFGNQQHQLNIWGCSNRIIIGFSMLRGNLKLCFTQSGCKVAFCFRPDKEKVFGLWFYQLEGRHTEACNTTPTVKKSRVLIPTLTPGNRNWPDKIRKTGEQTGSPAKARNLCPPGDRRSREVTAPEWETSSEQHSSPLSLSLSLRLFLLPTELARLLFL